MFHLRLKSQLYSSLELATTDGTTSSIGKPRSGPARLSALEEGFEPKEFHDEAQSSPKYVFRNKIGLIVKRGTLAKIAKSRRTCCEVGFSVTENSQVTADDSDARPFGCRVGSEACFFDEGGTFDVRRQGYRCHVSNLIAATGRTQFAKSTAFARAIEHWPRAMVKRLVNQCAHPIRFSLGSNNAAYLIVRMPDGSCDALEAVSKEHRSRQDVALDLTTYSAYLRRQNPGDGRPLMNEIVTLPFHAELASVEQDIVITLIKRFPRLVECPRSQY